jgi:hypothetical protein
MYLILVVTCYVILINTESGGGAFLTDVHNSILDSYLDVEKMDYDTLYSKYIKDQKK